MIYNDEAYKGKLGDLLNDIFYVEGMSYDGRIGRIRAYAEIIVRRILKRDPEKPLTLGHKIVQERLKKKKYSSPLLLESVEQINKIGSGSTHTQKTQPATKEEYEELVDNLCNLYAYLFYEYFKRNRFGSNNDVVSFFSILPPAIRHTTLNELFKTEHDNSSLVEHLVMVKVKAFNLDVAMKWIEENKELLMSLSVTVTQDYIQGLVDKIGEEMAKAIVSQMPTNMYDACKQKARDMAKIPAAGVPYTNFEEALAFYNKIAPIKGDADNVREFCELMEFVYCGRKAKERLREEYPTEDLVSGNSGLHVKTEDDSLDRYKKEDKYHFTMPFRYIKKNYGNDVYDDGIANMEIDVRWDADEHGYRITHHVPEMNSIDPAEGNGSEDEFYENDVEPRVLEKLLELDIDCLSLIGGTGR